MFPLPLELPSSDPLPRFVHGYASFRSQGGKSCFEVSAFPKNTEPFHGRLDDRRQAIKTLESLGFQIVAQSRLGAAIVGPSAAYEELTGGRLATRERLLHAEGAAQRYVTHVDIVGEGQPRALGLGKIKSPAIPIEGVVLERPRFLHGVWPSPLPPSVSTFHLRVPDDVALGVGAMEAHRKGVRGQNVKVAMVDSGQYAHPYFAAHGYNVQAAVSLVPGTSPAQDSIGHGTGESTNIFAAAPEAELHPFRAADDNGNLIAATSGFLKAKELKPGIITNSWGGDGPYPPPGPLDSSEMAWVLEIQDAVEQGILVVFSAGNGQFSVEPQIPQVLAAGGVNMANDLELQASDYASGYASPWFADRVVPDACGLVGMRPRAAYIMFPIPPGSPLDVEESRADDESPGDGTTDSDGWALFSGTSAAAPQLAGVAALLLSAKAGLTPAQIKNAITSTATDVTTGRCHPRFNNAATVGPDLATGAGLVNASAAVQFALTNF